MLRSPEIQVEVHEALCCIKSVQGATQTEPYIAGPSAELSYTMDIYTDLGFEPERAGIVPVGQRWPSPFIVRAPRPGTPEAWCRGFVYGIDLFVFVNEIPDWGPCNGETPDTPPAGTVPDAGMTDTPTTVPGPVTRAPRPDPLFSLIARARPETISALSKMLRSMEAGNG